MNIQVEPILLDQKSAFIQLLNLYNYDFSEFTGNDTHENGYYYNYSTEELWNDTYQSFFIRVEGKLAGFVIIKKGGYLYIDDETAHSIDEFFVMKKYRRSGVGRFAAEEAFDMFRGKWEVCQMRNNMPARKFWKSVVSKYTGNVYQEVGTENDDMVGFVFDTRRNAP